MSPDMTNTFFLRVGQMKEETSIINKLSHVALITYKLKIPTLTQRFSKQVECEHNSIETDPRSSALESQHRADSERIKKNWRCSPENTTIKKR